MKLWSGRFDKNTDELVDQLNASIGFDERMYRQDIAGSMAHAGMLGAQGIIDPKEAEQIIAALGEIREDIAAGKLRFDIGCEDIHMAVEGELTRRIGDAGKRLHTARSRNDQVALDIRLYLKENLRELQDMVLSLLSSVLALAEGSTDVIMPAYTHLQRAQPTTFAHYMMAYANMLRRDWLRLEDCYQRMDEMPLGSGALTATTYPIDRYRVAEELGFSRITQNSLDGVSDRDFVIELLGDLAHEIEDLNENAMDLAEEIDQLSDDLADVEEALDDCCCMNDECCCDDDDCCCKDDDCCCDEDDEPVFYEITCPKCGENLEFEFDTDEDEGCCCGKSDKE